MTRCDEPSCLCHFFIGEVVEMARRDEPGCLCHFPRGEVLFNNLVLEVGYLRQTYGGGGNG
jgi:hypothetical protein